MLIGSHPSRSPVAWLAAALVLVTGIIHLLTARDSFGDATYKGILFVLDGLGAAVAAAGILAGRRWGWWLGLAVAGGALVGYALSRTVGLPQLPAEPDKWLEPLGIASFAAEALFVLTFLVGRRG